MANETKSIEMIEMACRAIGVVRSPITDRPAMTPLGVPAAVEVFAEFAPALWRFEKHSHIWVFGWLDKVGRDALQVTPRGVKDQGEEGLHGVFSVRSPTRPTPIGLTAARVLSREGNRIELDRLDFIDGTLVVDIKPYLVTRDMIYCARNYQIGKAASREAIRDALLMQAEMYCGEVTEDARFAAEHIARFRAEQLGFVDPKAWRFQVPRSRPGLVDAVLAMTRVRFGNGGIEITNGDEFVIGAEVVDGACVVSRIACV
ncbi:MAG: tRNA (N6-threonylcarbamoyladenosine(37)-N6)-methyltransferase TrmO [Bryobacterales bacterium]|nr:tRNA (N6-threonylcarbamoyladenosine(37)-N6)-methyltransferase TrmO [Bryobacterales bacterium]